MKVIVGELPIDEEGYFTEPEHGRKFKAEDYVEMFPDVYRIEEKEEK